MLGKLGHFTKMAGADNAWDKIASEATRTVPGRENGGNCDIKNLSRGCTVYFPVFLPGASLRYVIVERYVGISIVSSIQLLTIFTIAIYLSQYG